MAQPQGANQRLAIFTRNTNARREVLPQNAGGARQVIIIINIIKRGTLHKQGATSVNKLAKQNINGWSISRLFLLVFPVINVIGRGSGAAL